MLKEIARIYDREGSVRKAAESINLQPEFEGHGPYRFNPNRTDFRFYLDNGVAYYRMMEMAIPQAISQWYLGSGGTVGFSSITGMATLHRLIALREQGHIDFQVWPQEGNVLNAGKHILAESYPAMYPEPASYGDCRDEHCRDAWKVLQWIIEAEASGTAQEQRQEPDADRFDAPLIEWESRCSSREPQRPKLSRFTLSTFWLLRFLRDRWW